LFLPDFHKAIPFRIISHITAIIINHKIIILANSVWVSKLDVSDASKVILIFFSNKNLSLSYLDNNEFLEWFQYKSYFYT